MSRPVRRVAVDGPDAAGKTTLADRLAADFGAARICADDFLRPVRPADVDGYYRRAFDYAALRAAVLAAEEDVIVDGVFLLRPELRGLWHFSILLDAPFALRLERAKRRGEEDVDRRYRERYQPAWELHVRECDPAGTADLVLQSST